MRSVGTRLVVRSLRYDCSSYAPRCRDMGLCMLLLLHAIIPCLCLHTAPCFSALWHFNPYTSFHILLKIFLILFHWILLCVATRV